jgi:cytochrome c oxidase cbb3-type subunit 4
MDLNIIRSAVTVILLLLFVLLCLYVWSGRRRAEFEAAARLPFEDGDLAEPTNAKEPS